MIIFRRNLPFGERLNQLMLDRKLRVRDLAYRSDVYDETINGYLRSRTFPSYKVLDKIIATLNPTDRELVWLMRGELRDE